MENMEKILLHTKIFEVRWGDMDAHGHVNNTNYFLYTQEARFALLLDNNIPIKNTSVGPVLADISCKFIRPIMFPETIVVETWLTNLEEKRAYFEHQIKSNTNDTLYAILNAATAWYDFRINKSIVIPQYINDLVQTAKSNNQK